MENSPTGANIARAAQVYGVLRQSKLTISREKMWTIFFQSLKPIDAVIGEMGGEILAPESKVSLLGGISH